MTLAVTAMVRDEADVIREWVRHHVDQGVDVIIVTDNASRDGTTQILEEFAEAGIVNLRHDPVHRKQQGSVVTQMARDAYTEFGATWVVNADADEFLLPVDRGLSLRDVFARLDPALASFTVPVVNLVGPPARTGAGFERLVWRDQRSNEQLRTVGVLAQPSPNAVHVGAADVTVVQGNHLVSIASNGAPPPGLELEVLHLPWRSWEQFLHKVEIAGAGYSANPDLTPSPNHHGMRDFRRLREGTLVSYYAARCVTEAEALEGDFQLETALTTYARTHVSSSDRQKAPHGHDSFEDLVAAGRALVARDLLVEELETRLVDEADAASATEAELRRHQAYLDGEIVRLGNQMRDLRARKVVRAVDALSSRLRRG